MHNAKHSKQKSAEPTVSGTVIKSTGSWYHVRLDEGGAVWPCRIIGKFRLDSVPITNPVAVGDRVEVSSELIDGLQQGMIRQIGARRNFVARQSPRRKHDLHLLAANVDQVVLISTVIEPTVKLGFLDRFLVMTERFELPVTLVFNKGDRWDAEAQETFYKLRHTYQAIGYKVLATSVVEKKGLEALRDTFKGKITLVSGQSGVGKSSLINAVQPGLGLRTGEISDHSGKGQHTTTFAEMFELDFGGRIIDTPGIKLLAFNDKDKQNIAHSFREFFNLSSGCRFGGMCLHRNEPGCAVQSALDAGEISPDRYMNYRSILEELEDQNYWERHKGID
jgi:ribosome biogenesis GTPase / thiamine phosphate phosphatase